MLGIRYVYIICISDLNTSSVPMTIVVAGGQDT